MCLCGFVSNLNGKYKFVLVFNRDIPPVRRQNRFFVNSLFIIFFEFELKFSLNFHKDREWKPVDFHANDNIVAGVDVKSQGTWLGVNVVTGRIVAITDHDDLKSDDVASVATSRKLLSRGKLVWNLLKTQETSGIGNCLSYPGFNIIIGNLFAKDSADENRKFRGFTNRPSIESTITTNIDENAVEIDISNLMRRDRAVFSFSNGSIDAPQLTGGPKVEWLNETMRKLVVNKDVGADAKNNTTTTTSTSSTIDEEIRSLIDELATALTAADLFDESQIVNFDLFAEDVYRNLDELLRCQQPFVNRLSTWATTSQTIVVQTNDNTIYFAERSTTTTHPMQQQQQQQQWRIFKISQSNALLMQ